MTDRDIGRLEADVEAARKKLDSDLTRLRSPVAYTELTEGVNQTASEVTTFIVDRAATSARSTLDGMVEEVKGKAAANPAATLAIGAGIAWQLLRHPPIATALIGAGLYSLWRTPAARVSGNRATDYFSHAKDRLGEQAADLAGEVSDRAVGLASDVRAQGLAAAEAVQAQSGEVLEAAKEKAEKWGENLSHFAREVPEQASALLPLDTRNNLLLGTAGLAVLAALGLAYNRRIGELDRH